MKKWSVVLIVILLVATSGCDLKNSLNKKINSDEKSYSVYVDYTEGSKHKCYRSIDAEISKNVYNELSNINLGKTIEDSNFTSKSVTVYTIRENITGESKKYYFVDNYYYVNQKLYQNDTYDNLKKFNIPEVDCES